MKSLLAVLCLVAMTACSEDPKAEATAFANRFSSYVAQNQLDSIRAVYPDAAECDSFAVKFNPDSLTVEADAQPNTYKVSVGGGLTSWW